MNHQNPLLDALEIVSAWDVPDEHLAHTVNDQAKLMVGINPEHVWKHDSEGLYVSGR